MSNLFSGISGRFRGGQSKNTGLKSPGGSNNNQGSSPTSTPGISNAQPAANGAPRMPPIPTSPSLSQTLSMSDNSSVPQASSESDPLAAYNLPKPRPLWLNNQYAKQIVKGNFMTLSAKPKTVESGEWLAHQGKHYGYRSDHMLTAIVVEHYRNLWNFVKVIVEKEDDGSSICNARTCPKMAAGPEPVEVPALEYIQLMQRWIQGKIDNPDIFPTDPAGVSFAHNSAGPNISSATYASGDLNTPGANTPPIAAGPTNLNTPLSQLSGQGDWIGRSSGFPQEFVDVCQTIFRQMFRVYAHLYWCHFVDPFYHLSISSHLNSCFSHFVLTATALDMLKQHDLEAMQPLIDLWAANGTLPPDSKAYQLANIAAGERLLQLAVAPVAT